MAPISPSSRESEDLTLPLSPSGSDASDKSSGMSTAPECSSATGPTSRDGETLLPTPTSQAAKHGALSPSEARGLRPQDEANLWTAVQYLLPTPKSQEPGWSMATHRTEGPNHRVYDNETGIHRTWGLQQAVEWTSSAEGFRVSPSAPPAAAREPQTTAGSGPSSPVSLARWDRDTSSWRTSQVSLLSTEDERFPRSWERWPTSGMTRRGEAFALPTSAPPTDASASSSLHTPTTGDTHPSYDHRASPGYTRAIPVPNLAAQVSELLPTPRHEGFDAGNHRGHPDSLNQTVRHLPTPAAADGTGGKQHKVGSISQTGMKADGTKVQVSLRDALNLLSSLGDHTPPPSNDGSE